MTSAAISWRPKDWVESVTGGPRFCEEGHVQGGELEVVTDGKAHQVGVGGVFVRGFGRICGTQIIGEKTMRRTGIEADQRTVGIRPLG